MTPTHPTQASVGEVRHTPGPWHAMRKLGKSFSDHGYRQVATVRGDLVIYAEASRMFRPGEGFVWGSAEDDAALIAAAPDLLSQLCAAEELIARRWGYPDDASSRASVLAGVRAAIARATSLPKDANHD